MRFGKSVWVSSRIDTPNAPIAEYEKPVEIVTRPNYFTVMKATTRGLFEIMKYGETAENTWTVIANGQLFDGKIKEGDVMWVDGESPLSENNAKLEEEYGYGCTANTVVKNVAEVNRTIALTLNRNPNKVIQ